MPRAKLKLDDPADTAQLADYIETWARRSTGGALPSLLQEYPHAIRHRGLRNPDSGFTISSYAKGFAATTHLRGRIAEVPCVNCRNGSGPFKHCVFLNGYDRLTKMCCSNCQWELYTQKRQSNLCTFAKGVYTSQYFFGTDLISFRPASPVSSCSTSRHASRSQS
jgi:hypothetical protein